MIKNYPLLSPGAVGGPLFLPLVSQGNEGLYPLGRSGSEYMPMVIERIPRAEVPARLAAGTFGDPGVFQLVYDDYYQILYYAGRVLNGVAMLYVSDILTIQGVAGAENIPTVGGVPLKIPVPRGLLARNGDRLVIKTTVSKSGGTAETGTLRWRLGLGDNPIGAPDADLTTGANLTWATTANEHANEFEIMRESATLIRRLGSSSPALSFGNSSTSGVSAVTVPNMDQNDLFLTPTLAMSASTEVPRIKGITVQYQGATV